MERFDITLQQATAIAAMLRDQLEDDERAYLDTLEGETDLYEWVRRLLGRIEEDEGVSMVLAEQISDRTLRKNRAQKRIEANREAITALLESAKLDKLSLPEATVSVRKVAPKLIVIDETKIPDELCKFTRKPDMAAIKAADSAVPGTALDNGESTLTIRRK